METGATGTKSLGLKSKENCQKKPGTTKKKICAKKLTYDNSSSDSSDDSDILKYNDSSSDEEEIDEICAICGEFGKAEMWYRCTHCGSWVHKQCSGQASAKNYVCDYCA